MNNLNYIVNDTEIELEFNEESHTLNNICDIVDKVVENEFKDNPIKKFKFIDKNGLEPNDLIEVTYVNGGTNDLFIYKDESLIPYDFDDDWIWK